MKAISAIVPVHNVDKYLHRCVDSILNQTFHDFELILIDDGSTDRSADICDEYQKVDGRIRVIHQENRGQAAARNRGVKEAKTKWIHFVDGDDFIHPQMLEFLWQALCNNHAGMSVARIFEANSPSEKFLETKEYSTILHHIDEKIMIDFQLNTYINSTPVAKLIKKDILLEYPFTEGRFYEDSAVVHQWIYYSGNLAEVPVQLYFYQINENSTTKGSFSIKRLDSLWALEMQLKFYYKIKYYEMYNMLRTFYFGTFPEIYNLSIKNHLPKRKIISIVIQAIRIWLQRFRKHCKGGMTLKGIIRILFLGLKNK